MCPYGKFPNRILAARAAEAQGLPNAYSKLVELGKTDPLNYFYESAPAPVIKIKSKRKVSCKKNKLDTITLTNGEEISWEEFSLWSERKQKTNLIPKSKETREKIRNSTIERWSDDEYRARIRNKLVGRIHSDDTKLKLSKLGGTGIMTPKGKFPSIRAASRAFNVSDSAIRNWLWKSKTEEFYIAK